MKLQGSTASGIYTLKKEDEDARLGYCDMSINGYLEAELETQIGYLEAFPSPGRIMFSVYRDQPSNSYIPAGDITYSNMVQNVGTCVDLDTGIFVTPLSGIYQFTFSAESHGSRTYVYAYVNGQGTVLILNDQSTSGQANFSYTWHLQLNAGDTVQLKIIVGEIYVNSNGRRITFTGYLVQPTLN